MSSSPQLAPAGSSLYTSNTMSVGDGTWDSSRNTFLLPNLVGLNFNTMRYNGMGNRFRELPGYYNLVQVHGILAAITFLLIVPSAILTVRFYGRNPRWAVRIHIWLQIMTVLLTTVIFTLGWFAVGPSRKLSNPHHGIGLTIYVLVLLQAAGGWLMHRKEGNKKHLFGSIRATLHHWFGRAIALLGLAQIPLGLTLYGSPLALFVLYALALFVLLVAYFILSYLRERSGGSEYDSRYSYGTGSAVEERRHGPSGNLIKGALAGAGLYALANRFRRRSDDRDNDPEVVGSHRHSRSSVEDEKYSRYGRDADGDGRWGDRLMRVAAPLGAAGLAAWFLNRRHRDGDSDTGSYGAPLGGTTAINEGRHEGNRPPGGLAPPGGPIPYSQPQGGPIPYNQPQGGPVPYNQAPGGPIPLNQPLPSGQHPLNRPPSTMTHSSFESASGEPRRGHGLRDGIATLGAFGLMKSIFNRRRDRRDDQRYEDEQDARMHGQHFTGDGRPPRHHRRATSSISSATSLTGTHPHNAHGIPPLPAGAYPGAAGAAVSDHEAERLRQEELPLGGVPRPVSMPPIPPDPQGLFRHESSGSEAYASPGGRGHHRHHAGRDTAAAGFAGGANGQSAGEASSSRQTRPDPHQSASAGEESMVSPPISLKVKMHPDGRAVTFRRLPQEVATREREARQRSRSGKRVDDSISSLSGSDVGGPRFRRRDAQEQQNAAAMRAESANLAAARAQASRQNVPSNLPQPPPIPESSAAPPPAAAGSGVSSPGGTDASASWANNRQRRRAERASARQAKEGRSAKTVVFEE